MALVVVGQMLAAGQGWDTLYEAAVENIDVLPGVEAAVPWANAFVQRIVEGACRGRPRPTLANESEPYYY